MLLVAAAGSGAGLNPSERFAFSLLPPSARRLVVLHDARCEAVSGTSAWLDERDFVFHASPRCPVQTPMMWKGSVDSSPDTQWGSSRGPAVRSVVRMWACKAFNEAGTNFRYLRGNVQRWRGDGGSACHLRRSGEGRSGHRQHLCQESSVSQPDTAVLSILNHRTLDRALREEYGDVLIEGPLATVLRCFHQSQSAPRPWCIVAGRYGRQCGRPARYRACCRRSIPPMARCSSMVAFWRTYHFRR